MPIAPGTFGTLAAVPPAIIIYYFGTVPSVISLIVIIPLSVWTSNVTQKLLGKDDPSEIVIDEVAGFFVTVFLLPFSWLSFTLGFLLFRVFDILKPFPIGMIDKKIKGGTGIVLDDIVAGIYANICVRAVQAILDRGRRQKSGARKTEVRSKEREGECRDWIGRRILDRSE